MKGNDFSSDDHDMGPMFLPLVAKQNHIQMSVDTLARQQQQMQARLDEGLKTVTAGIDRVMQAIQKSNSHGKSLQHTVPQHSKQNVEEDERHLSPGFGEDKNENGSTPRITTPRALSIASLQNGGRGGLDAENDLVLVKCSSVISSQVCIHISRSYRRWISKNILVKIEQETSTSFSHRFRAPLCCARTRVPGGCSV